MPILHDALKDKNGLNVSDGDVIELDEEFGPPDFRMLTARRTVSNFSGRVIWYGTRLPPYEPMPRCLHGLDARFSLVRERDNANSR